MPVKIDHSSGQSKCVFSESTNHFGSLGKVGNDWSIYAIKVFPIVLPSPQASTNFVRPSHVVGKPKQSY